MNTCYNRQIMFCFFYIIFLIFITHNNLFAQNGLIHGTVKDLDGNPIDATVRYSGGTALATNGVFEIRPMFFPDTIKFTSIGYDIVIRIVHTSQQLNIKLKPSVSALEEVVINTGYQTLNPNEMTGSVSTISSYMLTSRTSGNILDRIQGHTSGLTKLIGKRETQGGTGVLIRGMSTIHGPREPLIILDGFIYDGNINNIDPNIVENVSILKDASASSIWGARAGNGVIVITTKKGRLDQALRISSHLDWSIQAPPALKETYKVGAETHIELEKFLFEKGYFDNRLKNTPYFGLSPIVDLLSRRRDGLVSESDFEKEIEFWMKQDSRQNYKNEFYTSAQNQNIGLSIDGGGDRNAFLLGASYQNQKDNLYSPTQRLNLRINNQFHIFSNLILSTNIQLTNNFSKLGRSGYGTFTPGGRTVDYLAFRDDNGNPMPIDQTYKGRYTDSIGKGVLLDWKYYPTEEYKHFDSHKNLLDLFSTIQIKYQYRNWLNLTSSFQYQVENSEQIVYSYKDSYNSRDLINQYTQYDSSTEVIKYIVPLGGIYKSSDANVHSYAWRNQGNFEEQFGVHRINGILGIEFRSSGTSSKTNGTMYGYQEDPLNYTIVDLQTRYPHFITGANTMIGASNQISKTDYRFISYYGNIAYNYLNRYTITGSARRDGSNLFGVNINDRWKPLWSVGLSWNIANESFFAINFLSELKIFSTYGRSGNVDMTKTALPIASSSTHRETGFKFSRISSINNPELRWEQLDHFNVRLETSSKNRKINGSVSFFKKYGSDLFGESQYDITAWGVKPTILRNVASMEGYGVDIDLNVMYIENEEFNWKGVWYLNWNENKTTSYHLTNTYSENSNLLVDGTIINPVVGRSLYGIAAYQWAGLNEFGNPVGYIDGLPSTNYQGIIAYGREVGDNIKYFGSAVPRYFGSIINHFRYQAIQFTVALNFHAGYFFKKTPLNYSSVINSNIHKDYLNRWQEPGDEFLTNVPVFSYPINSQSDGFYGNSEVHVVPGDHIRLDYMRLSYQLNTSQWNSPFRNFEIHTGLENGMLIWKKNKVNIDPNYLDGSQTRPILSFGIKVQY